MNFIRIKVIHIGDYDYTDLNNGYDCKKLVTINLDHIMLISNEKCISGCRDNPLIYYHLVTLINGLSLQIAPSEYVKLIQYIKAIEI